MNDTDSVTTIIAKLAPPASVTAASVVGLTALVEPLL